MPRLRCYNAFLTQYLNIDELISDVPRIAGLGFNSLWLGPFSKLPTKALPRKMTKVANYGAPSRHTMDKSIYAPEGEYDKIDVSFLSQEDRQFVGEDEEKHRKITQQKLKKLTEICKKHGISPIADLVLGHVSLVSKLPVNHPELFDPKAKAAFQDTIPYCYVKPKASAEERKTREEMMINYWRKIVDTYIDEFGFSGFRVDNVAGVIEQGGGYLRENLYPYIMAKIKKPIILDEFLFLGRDEESYLRTIDSAVVSEDSESPNYIMGSLMWIIDSKTTEHISWQSKIENGLKAASIARFRKRDGTLSEPDFSKPLQGGVVSSCGNHDYVNLFQSCCEEVVKILVSERHKDFYPIAKRHSKLLEMFSQIDNKEKEEFKSIYIVAATSMVMKAFELAESNEEFRQEFRKRVLHEAKRRIALSCFATSGGHLMLRGDEDLMPQRQVVFAESQAHPIELSNQMLREFTKTLKKKNLIYIMDELSVEIIRILRREKPGLEIPQEKYDDVIFLADLLKKELPQDERVKAITQTVQNLLNKRCEQIKNRIKTMNDEGWQSRTLLDQDFGISKNPEISNFVVKCNRILSQLEDVRVGGWTEIIELESGMLGFVICKKQGLVGRPTIVLANPTDQKLVFGDNEFHELCCKFEKQNGGEYGSGHYIFVKERSSIIYDGSDIEIQVDSITLSEIKRADSVPGILVSSGVVSTGIEGSALPKPGISFSMLGSPRGGSRQGSRTHSPEPDPETQVM